MAENLLTPTKITAWLDCAHYLTLKNSGGKGVNQSSEMADLLREKGLAHEQAVLDRYLAKGYLVHEVSGRPVDESFEKWTERVGDLLAGDLEVIFQMPFVHDGIRGVADFLERVEVDGGVTYEPVDAKLVRAEAKPGHVLQLCFYAEAIAVQTGIMPEQMHIELGSGQRETIRTAEVLPYWRRLRSRLAAVIADPVPEQTYPEPCNHCRFCEFTQACEQQWRGDDSLIYVAGARKSDRDLLSNRGIDTLAALAALDREVLDLDPLRREVLVTQAALQQTARDQELAVPPHLIVETEPDSLSLDAVLTGFPALPEPAPGDVFLDFEGHPFWRADVGLFFLFGLIEEVAGDWTFRAFWAHDQAQEKQATADLIDYLAKRRQQYPSMHVYHYNHTERSSLERLTQEHSVREVELEQLIRTGLFVDLYRVITGGVMAGVESYGLKKMEVLAGFERTHEVASGSGAVIQYEEWMADKDPRHLQDIADYNEDDVRATLAVRDWLVAIRPPALPWRPAVIDFEVKDAELDERIRKLHSHEVGTAEHLMGDLLGYWRRERSVQAAEVMRNSLLQPHEQIEAPAVVAQLDFVGLAENYGATGRKLKYPKAVFSFPSQALTADIRANSTLVFPQSESEWVFLRVLDIDHASGRLEVEAKDPDGTRPDFLVHYDRVPTNNHESALYELSGKLLEKEPSVPLAILRREPARFTTGFALPSGQFTGDTAEICQWAVRLDGSFVPIQGPPGTGKTYTGAHLIRALVQGGLRVGVTATSHAAIDNLMSALVEHFPDELDQLKPVRKGETPRVTGVHYLNNGTKVAQGDFNVIGGTTWLFTSAAMKAAPVDVLIIDEAGQMGLADALAAATSATNVILLGDPQQLPQVSQAVHPNRSGVSVMEHLLGQSQTLNPTDGVLLDVTRRMHPDVCEFISEVMYEARLTSHESCEQQTTTLGTGLRWLQARHTGRATEAPEEAELVVATVGSLLGTNWTNQKGEVAPIEQRDIIVVAPYNDQRRLLESTLAAAGFGGIEVGTVDKFQGRQAAVVLYSMTTSSAEVMPRDAGFLFSKNRLNVAISRARCLAYLICTEELLDTPAATVEQMKLIAALCSFVERAEHL